MRRKITMAILAAFLALALLAGLAYAGNGFAVNWYVQASGGGSGTMSGSGYQVTGTLGQTAISTSSYGSYTAQQGFWAILLYRPPVFLPLIRR